jgi:hypothetical protein
MGSAASRLELADGRQPKSISKSWSRWQTMQTLILLENEGHVEHPIKDQHLIMAKQRAQGSGGVGQCRTWQFSHSHLCPSTNMTSEPSRNKSEIQF